MIKINLNKKFEYIYYNKIVNKSRGYTGLKYKFDSIKTNANEKLVNFLEKLTITKNYKDSILIQNPPELKKSISRIKRFLKAQEVTQSQLETINSVYDYDSFKKRIGLDFAKELGIDVCPYCNRNWIPNIEEEKEEIVRSAYDHFYPKSEYPYLAISLYNLIPACSTCNQFKGDKEGKFINPHEGGYLSEITFKRSPKNINGILTDPESFTVRIDIKKSANSKKRAIINNQIKKLRLGIIYKKFHNNQISQLIKRAYIYNDAYLADIFKQHEGTLFSSMDELKSIVFGAPMQEEDIGKMPLGKLTYDILKELRG